MCEAAGCQDLTLGLLPSVQSSLSQVMRLTMRQLVDALSISLLDPVADALSRLEASSRDKASATGLSHLQHDECQK